MEWLVGGLLGLAVVLCGVIAYLIIHDREHARLDQRVRAIEDRFREAGIDFADTMATEVKTGPRWQEWDDDPEDQTPAQREEWRD